MIVNYSLPNLDEVNNRSFNKSYDKLTDYTNNLPNDVNTSYITLSALTTAYAKISADRKSKFREIERVKDNYLIETIVSQIVDDALSAEITGDILKVSVKNNKKAEKAIEEFNARINFDQLVSDVAPELVRYGDYTLQNIFADDKDASQYDVLTESTKNNKGGILDILDNLTPGSVIPVVKNGEVSYFITQSKMNNIRVRELSDFTHFSMSGSKVKIDLQADFASHTQSDEYKDIIRKLPRHLRVGKSFIYHILEKLRNLDLLEKLVPATKIAKLSAGNIVGANMPEKTEIKIAKRTARELENMINAQTGVTKDDELSVQDILNTSGRTKVVPLFGEKGRIERLDYKSDEPDDLLSSVNDIRRIICDSIGVPYELLFNSDGDNKQELLRRYGRYLRKLKKLRRSLAEGIKHLIFVHLSNSGISFKKSDIEVNFLNTLIEIDNLDKLEHADITISSLSNIYDFFSRSLLSEESPLRNYVRVNKLADYLDAQLSTIGISDVFDLEGIADLESKGPYFTQVKEKESSSRW